MAFSYSWSGPTTPTSNDMIEAIVAAGFLNWEYTDYSFGRALTIFPTEHDRGCELLLGTGLGDVVDPGVEWVGSPVGVSDNFLSNNSLDGWYNGFNDDFSTIPPALPWFPPRMLTALLLVAAKAGDGQAAELLPAGFVPLVPTPILGKDHPCFQPRCSLLLSFSALKVR